MEDRKLELRIGPPGDHDSTTLGYNSSFCGIKRGFVNSTLLEGKTSETAPPNAVVPTGSSEKRTAAVQAVGWPPIHSCRKNLGTISLSKSAFQSPNKVSKVSTDQEQFENLGKSSYMKVNMDGVPIGRKVDLKAYSNYETLYSAVDELFRGLLAAQMEHSGHAEEDEMLETEAKAGLLDGSGEYTLVYEDNEGDRMLVGDVPWHMFVSTAKRLRVLKRSELSSLQVNSNKIEKATTIQ